MIISGILSSLPHSFSLFSNTGEEIRGWGLGGGIRGRGTMDKSLPSEEASLASSVLGHDSRPGAG